MCSWTTIDKPESVNFADIVSEEKLRSLQTKKENQVSGVVKDRDQTVTDVDIITKELRAKTDDTLESSLGDQELKHSNNANEELQVALLFDSIQGVSLNDGKITKLFTIMMSLVILLIIRLFSLI